MTNMDSFVSALAEKIRDLEGQKERLDAKIEILRELMEGETGVTPPPAQKRKSGRPKGSKNKKSAAVAAVEQDGLYEEAIDQLGDQGTTPEMQKKRVAAFKPAVRATDGLGPGIRAGTVKQVLGDESPSTSSHKQISIKDEEE